MMLEPPTARWQQEVCAVIVGLQSASRSIERVYVHRDGRMVGTGRVHRLPKGALALDEAASVFGLSQAKEFSILSLIDADVYAVQLRRTLAGLAPSAVDG